MSDIAPNSLVVEIVGRLVADGRFITYVEAGRLQDVVDVGWAARQAGQLLGRQVRISSTPSREFEGKLKITAVMTESVADPGSAASGGDDTRRPPTDEAHRHSIPDSAR